MKINFKLLGTFETACILDWSSKETHGVLPLSESTFNLYPELRDKINISLDNTNLIYEIIKDRIDDFNKKNKSILNQYQNLWNQYNDQYIKIMEDYFGVKINNDVNAYLGLLPVCPRFIKELMFYYDKCDNIRFIDICMHELCHFYFFELCKRLFKDWTYDDFNNPSLLWYLSEISIDAILNREEVQKIFRHQFRCYDNFYNIYINGECIVDIIKNIFDNNDMEVAIKECLQFLKDNEKEFRNKCEGKEDNKIK